MKIIVFVSTVALFFGSQAAAETITYSYDAKGRLIRVVKSGGPNAGATTTYEHDTADNRKRVTTAGALR